MEAAVVLLIVVLLAILVWGGITLKKHIEATYDYDIYSPAQMVMGCVAVILLIAAAFVYDAFQAVTLNVIVLLSVAVIIYAMMFMMNLQKLSAGLAILTVFYQILLSAIIALVIIYFLMKIFGSGKKK